MEWPILMSAIEDGAQTTKEPEGARVEPTQVEDCDSKIPVGITDF